MIVIVSTVRTVQNTFGFIFASGQSHTTGNSSSIATISSFRQTPRERNTEESEMGINSRMTGAAPSRRRIVVDLPFSVPFRPPPFWAVELIIDK